MEWSRRHDPDRYALHRALKVAFVVTVGLALGNFVVADAQVSVFACFGGMALLLFAEFPGSRTARFGAYLGLVVGGTLLIVVGTLVSRTPWLAVVAMAVVGFGILFAGVLSPAVSGASRAALLAFVLPVMVPAAASDIPVRLGGWGIAVALSLPAALLVWPPRDHDELRSRASDACDALANQLGSRAGLRADDGTDARAAVDRLREQFDSTEYRPVGLSSGGRILMSLTDRLEWLASVVEVVPVGGADAWHARVRELVGDCADVLWASAEVLAVPAKESRDRLDATLQALDRHHHPTEAFVELVVDGDDRSRGALTAAVTHDLVYTSYLAGHTVAASAAADARPVVDRLLGRRDRHALETRLGGARPVGSSAAVGAAQRIAARHLTVRSLWFQNSLRGALGLSIAVLLAEVTDVSHGFWVVLGTMSVLRTSAVNTGSTALRALGGTLLGFFVGAALIDLVGTSPGPLWALLPFVVVLAAYLPQVASFAAGQAAFTILVVVLFNLIEPVGWRIGIVRIEDVALGCVAGVVSGVLLWPRGAAGRIRRALADAYERSTKAMEAATAQLVRGDAASTVASAAASEAARDAGYWLDDVVREYLSERGTRSVPLRELTAASNGANRVRLAAEAIVDLARVDAARVGDVGPAPAAAELSRSAEVVGSWFEEVGAVLRGVDSPGREPLAERDPQAQSHVLAAVRSAPGHDDRVVTERAHQLWAAALYVDDLARLEERLAPRIAALVGPAGRRPIREPVRPPAPSDGRASR